MRMRRAKYRVNRERLTRYGVRVPDGRRESSAARGSLDSPAGGMDTHPARAYAGGMKTEELLAYEAMYAVMREALATSWLEFHPCPALEPADPPAAQPDVSSRSCSGSRK